MDTAWLEGFLTSLDRGRELRRRLSGGHTIMTPGDFLLLFANKPPHFAPGSGSRYCNASYVVAGMAVEHGSGQDFREYVETEVLARDGMTRSGYFDKRRTRVRTARPRGSRRHRSPLELSRSARSRRRRSARRPASARYVVRTMCTSWPWGLNNSRSGTLPSTYRPAASRPRLPITIRSAPISSATAAIRAAGSPWTRCS